LENDKTYLEKELKQNQVEEKAQPNTLLQMQEAANAPWGKEFTKSSYVEKVKAADAETQYEPPKEKRI